MDGQGGFKVIYKHDCGASLTVDFKPDLYARAPHPDAATESLVSARWKAALEKNGRLFNAAKFRFAGIHPQKNESGTYVLRLGLTDYASFVGSHSGRDPLSEFGMRCMASPIGNAIVAETSDGYLPMLVRCAAVGEGSGYVVFPGGHPEPDELTDDGTEGVRMELWNAARRELIEELFLENEQVPPASEFECLGFVSRDHDGKVCQVFRTRISAGKATVEKQYTAGNINKEESTEMLFLKKSQLYQDHTLTVNRRKIMPDHLGALQLCKMHSLHKET